MTSTPIQNTPPDLAGTLLQIARERGASIEHLRADQLLAESRHAWSGDVETMWSKWLAEAAKSLGLRARTAHLSIRVALDLVEDGAVLVAKPPGQETIVVLNYDGRYVTIAGPGTADPKRLKQRELADIVQPPSGAKSKPADVETLWLIVEDLELGHEPSHFFHGRPVSRLLALLRPERSDIWVVVVFAFFAGILSLATPIAVESLVNTVAFGQLLQPLVVLSLMLFGFLAFASMMRAVQTFVVEIIQRRLFARVAADLAYRFPRITKDALAGNYGPELANRFFDVITLQKVVAQLLLDGIATVLATVIGMAVLAFYHPWLLGFDALLLLFTVGGILLLGRGALATGIDESKQKYRLAAWLEDLIRCPVGFKAAGALEFALDRANQITADYLASRRIHFRILYRQLLFLLGLQAVAGTVLLGFGGWLVIRGQLTLGQLVAAELIVAMILGSSAKLGKHIESFYDVIASVDKLGHLFDLDIEPQDGLLALGPGEGVRLRIADVRDTSGEPSLQRGFSLDIGRGKEVALLGRRCAGSTVLFDLLYGLRTPDAGHVEIENADPRDLRPDILRGTVALARRIEVFEGTIAENIQMARSEISIPDVRSALSAVGLLDDIRRLPKGLDTKINAGGAPLMNTQLHLLMLARAIVGSPRLLMIDGVLDALGDAQLRHVCEILRNDSRSWTLIVATNRADVAGHFSRVVEIERDV